jgi:hypothetical protein
MKVVECTEVGVSNVLAPAMIIICHSSYEDRCLGLLNHSEFLALASRAVVVHTEGFSGSQRYAQNHRELVGCLKKRIRGTVEEVGVRRAFGNDLLKCLDTRLSDDLKVGARVAVDVSTFPRERMIILVDYLTRVGSGGGIGILYHEPERYASEAEKDSGAWLSKGVRRIASIPGFNGRQSVRKNCLLVVQLGHESERALMTIKKLEPDKIIVVGQSGQQYKAGLDQISLRKSESVINECGHKLQRIFLVGSRDYWGAYNAMRRIGELYGNGYNIVVNLNGTKVQVLGALKYCQENRSIEVIHADPQTYNYASYSEGVGKCWCFGIHTS